MLAMNNMAEIRPETIRRIPLKFIAGFIIGTMIILFIFKYGDVIIYAMIHDTEVRAMKAIQKNSFLMRIGN